jgi:hypothetical protein
VSPSQRDDAIFSLQASVSWLRDAEAQAWGGLWITSHGREQHLTVAVTDVARWEPELRARTSRPDLLRVVQVEHSEIDLLALQERVTLWLIDRGRDLFVDCCTDRVRNAVVVGLKDRDAAIEASLRAEVAGPIVVELRHGSYRLAEVHS